MIRVTVESRCGAAAARCRVTAPSIERAMELAGEGASLVLPIEPEEYFQAPGVAEGVEDVHAPGREERAWITA